MATARRHNHDAVRRDARELRREGLTAEQIAAKLGMNAKTLYRIVGPVTALDPKSAPVQLEGDPALTTEELAPVLGYKNARSCGDAINEAGVAHCGIRGRAYLYRLSAVRAAMPVSKEERKRRALERSAATLCENRALRDREHGPERINRRQPAERYRRSRLGYATFMDQRRIELGERSPPPLIAPCPGDGWQPPVPVSRADELAGRALWAAIVRSAA